MRSPEPRCEVPGAQVRTPAQTPPRYLTLSRVKHTAEPCTGHAWPILSEGRAANLNHDTLDLESGAPQASPLPGQTQTPWGSGPDA